MTEENNKPFHKISVGSGIIASIWRNITANGPLYAVEVERRYKDNNTGDWKTSNSYVGTQVILVAKVYEMAFDYIASLKQQPDA